MNNDETELPELRLAPTPEVWDKVQKDNADLRALLEECREWENTLSTLLSIDMNPHHKKRYAEHRTKLTAKLEEGE